LKIKYFEITTYQKLDENKIFSTTGVEEFLADKVVVLYALKHGNVRENALEILKIKKPCGFLLHTEVWSLFWFLDTENFLSRVVFCAEKIRGEIFSCSQKNTRVIKPQHRKIFPIRFGIFGITKSFGFLDLGRTENNDGQINPD